MAVDPTQVGVQGDQVRLYDVINVAPTTVTDFSGNLVDGLTITFAVANLANQTIDVPLHNLTVSSVHTMIVNRVFLLVELLDIEGPMVSLDADGKPILPNSTP